MPILEQEPQIYPENLFESRQTTIAPTRSAAEEPYALRWWVAHVRSRQEKLLARHLRYHEVPHYLPQRQHRWRRNGRWHTAFIPLFTGYVFFRGAASARLAALRSNLTVNILEEPPCGTLEPELRALWALQTSGKRLIPHPYLAAGDAVQVVDGPFKGYRGTIVREKGVDRLVVSITLLRQSVATELDRELLAPAEERRLTA